MVDGCDIVVVGGCNFDYLIRGLKLPLPGETTEGNELQEAPGGKGANQAIGAARLGASVAFIARIGSDARGDACHRQLVAEGVNTTGMVRDSTSPTGVAFVMVDQAGQKQIMTAPGANRQLSVDDIRNQRPLLQAARVALAQLEAPIDSVLAAFQVCREVGATTVLDPAPAAPLPDELLKLIDVIRANSTEAEVLTGIPVHDRGSALKAARQLIDRGVKSVIVQAGDEGNLAVWAGGQQWLPKYAVKSIDATGAGDAFAAALAVELARGASVSDAAIFANAAAALATTRLGAQAGLPGRVAVEQLLKQSSNAAPASAPGDDAQS